MPGNLQSSEEINKTQFEMLTDSRSFVSYPRHEYFRRILCNLIGIWIENGEYVNDLKQVGKIVEDICLNNARRYFRV
ncbi:glucuronate isomerase [Maledivibacter halophilus]|uniref:Uronate isomerase n=1 Tax=Maledivibacter halophilus TaxID=36842 RepID=A0A1T5M1Q1_9FIRM|nr:glucuronate isomerase [Maledivibacter halophilus]SKC82053.1 Glucuronate isomerase [Maledivibacter halophilus]